MQRIRRVDPGHVPPAPEPSSIAGALLDCVDTGLVCIDARGAVLVANAAAGRLLGFSVHHLPPSITDAPGLSSSDRTRLHHLILGDQAGPLRLCTQQGLTLSITAKPSEQGRVLLSVVPAGFAASPASPRTDALTGLADRQAFNERLAALLSTGEPVALMMIDLDRFKLVNDTLGHAAGDGLLRLVGRRLRETFRGADVVSRFGGDEFAVALSAGPEIASIAERLVRVLSRPYLVERQSAVVGASIGLAFAPAHASSAADLLRAADLALYQAKADGRGTVRVFDAELDSRARSRGTLADELRRAIPMQELRLHFQPQLCLQTRELTGFEALVRWPHKDRGLIPPDQFIPIAEDMGVIIPLGEWVLHEACRQAMTWPGHITVAVNVSPKQLVDRDRLPATIATVLAKTGLPPHRLEIEITETALINEAEAFAVLTAIRKTGVRVSMDDFGTGYSSLSQLRRFPFDKLKIDRSFVRDLGGSSEAAAVVRAIAALGRSLGMATVAEGVENADQEEICRNDGCSTMQGYLVSKPVPAGDVRALIETLRNPPSP